MVISLSKYSCSFQSPIFFTYNTVSDFAQNYLCFFQVCTPKDDIGSCDVVCVHGKCNAQNKTCECEEGFNGEDCSGIIGIIGLALETFAEKFCLFISFLWSIFNYLYIKYLHFHFETKLTLSFKRIFLLYQKFTW